MPQDNDWSSTKVMAWVTWAASVLFALSAFVVNGPLDHTSNLGMVLCTIAIILAAAATTQHVRSFVCALRGPVDNAYKLGQEEGRRRALEEFTETPLQRIH